MSLYCEKEKLVFTGDTLFRLSVGRTDLEGGNPSKLRNSLKILSKIEKDLKIYPGHDAQTRLEIEKTENIFLKYYILTQNNTHSLLIIVAIHRNPASQLCILYQGNGTVP